ncbi:adenosylcobinamide-GDP ribazoletransferase [Marilutibacter aestuarii]
MRGLWVAIGFLTRIPVPASAFAAPDGQARSLPWYPLVGVGLGVLLSLLAACLPASMPQLAASLVLLAWVGLTGGLHLDGLADSADAWIGGLGDRARTLAIMKDPRSGPAGVVALVLVLLLKFAALSSLLALPSGSVCFAVGSLGLLLAPWLARAALAAALLAVPYVRDGGIGQALPRASRPACHLALSLTVLACLLPALGLPGVPVAWLMPTLVALLAAAAITGLWLRACLARIGGITGDTCGALAEMVEAGVLVAVALALA